MGIDKEEYIKACEEKLSKTRDAYNEQKSKGELSESECLLMNFVISGYEVELAFLKGTIKY